jgi:TonB family protein
MRTCIILLLQLFFISGISQNLRYEFGGRSTPSIKMEKLNEAKFINQAMPDFCRYVTLPPGERSLLNEQLKLTDLPNEFSADPREYFDPTFEKYSKVLYFVSMEISVLSKGKTLRSGSTDNLITAEQKNILAIADLGSDIHIKIRFRYKNRGNISFYDLDQIKEGEYTVTVIPATEAEFPGGFSEISNYLNKTVFNKIPAKNTSEKVRQVVVRFTISEEGQVTDAKLSRTSKDPATDKLLLDAISKMPKWKPARDSKGTRVKQEYCIPFGNNNGSC